MKNGVPLYPLVARCLLLPKFWLKTYQLLLLHACKCVMAINLVYTFTNDLTKPALTPSHDLTLFFSSIRKRGIP